jgi:hypothetical protein
MSDFEVQGAEQLEALAKRLKAAGAGDLRKELLRGIRETNKPTIEDIRKSALDTLPRRGGLADRIARSKISTRTRTAGRQAGVEIKGVGIAGASGKKHDIARLNKGLLRHPLFGNRDRWYGQGVRAGWFNNPIEKRKPEIQRGLQRVMEDVARKVAR